MRGRKRYSWPVLVLAAQWLVAAGSAVGSGSLPAYRSPLALVADATAEGLFVIDATAQHLAEVERLTGRVRREIPLPGAPAALALSPDGRSLAVAGGGAAGAVWLVDAATGQVTDTLVAGHTPSAVGFSRDGSRLFVAHRFLDALWVFDRATRVVLARVPTGREPVALVLTPDGRQLVVAALLPGGSALDAEVAATVTLIDAIELGTVATVRLPNGSTSARGVAVSPDGDWAYVTHVLGRYQSPTTQLERGWMNTNAVSLIDLRNRRRRATVLLDSVEQGAANPWGVAVSADGAWLAVAHAGSHEISVIDRGALHRKLEAGGAGLDPIDDLDFLVGVQRRERIDGLGPRGLIVVEDKAYSTCYYSDRLVALPLAPAGTGAAAQRWPLGPAVTPTGARLGEIAFHDAGRCFQHWQSCSSCHPEGRVDGLNWDLMNDGLGNPKNTKSMLAAHATPPAMWLGVRASAEVAVRSGFRHIQYAVVDETTAKAVDRYLREMPAVPSPRLVAGRLSAAAQRGQNTFGTLGCATCHPPPYYTDQRTYDLGTTQGVDAGRPVDVPTLVEGWRTAPYLHNGSAATLRDVLTTRNPEKRHGDITGLTGGELDDLVEFLLSL